jgi:[ribosomal protein S5]-alanine N-acetyltransferase
MINLTGELVQLCCFDKAFINDEYISWLNDLDVVKYSNQRFIKHTKLSSLNYLESFSKTDNLFLTINEKQTNRFIGTMTIYIEMEHRTADIGIMIGNKNYWGCGMGGDAWDVAIKYIFKEYNFRKITAGTASENFGMIKIMKNAGMHIEAVRAKQHIFSGEIMDTVHCAIFNNKLS